MKPDVKGVNLARQADQKQYHNRHVRQRYLFPGTPVMGWNVRDARKWSPGMIVHKLGPVTYNVDIGAGRTVKKHTDQ